MVATEALNTRESSTLLPSSGMDKKKLKEGITPELDMGS